MESNGFLLACAQKTHVKLGDIYRARAKKFKTWGHTESLRLHWSRNLNSDLCNLFICCLEIWLLYGKEGNIMVVARPRVVPHAPFAWLARTNYTFRLYIGESTEQHNHYLFDVTVSHFHCRWPQAYPNRVCMVMSNYDWLTCFEHNQQNNMTTTLLMRLWAIFLSLTIGVS